MTFKRTVLIATSLSVATLLGFPAGAAPQTPDCRILQSITQPALLGRLRVGFAGTKAVSLTLVDGTKFSRHASSCDLDANDPMTFNCDWEFDNKVEAGRFYQSMLAVSRSCLGYALTDDLVPIDPADGNDWNPVRSAEEEGGDYEIQLVEYGVRNFVTLNVYPMNLRDPSPESNQ